VNSQSSSDFGSSTDPFRGIRAVAMDVDGVLTDGGFWWSPGGEELKRFCFADVTGISRARAAGLIIALVSGESSPDGMALVQRFADKVKIADVYKGCHDKSGALQDLVGRHGLRLSEVCYIGDDVIDIPAMEIAGLAVAPPNAQPAVLAKAGYVTRSGGGHGAVREVLENILNGRSPTG
jgi:3-deoxy-D-manno-octulosonate 8-phosphate phosphatase (KDO 8-P phosphatase)